MKLSAFIATSLDGYIARQDGNLDWLDRANASMPAGEDCGYNAFIASVDTLVVGRMTYEKALGFGDWPYGHRRVVVLSGSRPTIDEQLRKTVEHAHESPRSLATRLAREGAMHVYVDGGVTIRGFLQDGLIDEITITTIPVLIGEGRPLFGVITDDIPLSLKAVKVYSFGFVQATYAVNWKPKNED